jgi:hypothetical protein
MAHSSRYLSVVTPLLTSGQHVHDVTLPLVVNWQYFYFRYFSLLTDGLFKFNPIHYKFVINIGASVPSTISSTLEPEENVQVRIPSMHKFEHLTYSMNFYSYLQSRYTAIIICNTFYCTVASRMYCSWHNFHFLAAHENCNKNRLRTKWTYTLK